MVGEDDFVRTDGSVLEIVERPAEGQQASALKHMQANSKSNTRQYAEGSDGVFNVCQKVT
jgi:hypothetical protein